MIAAHLDNVLGLIAKVHGDYAGARTHYQAALATLKAAKPDGPEIAATLANLSVVEAGLGDLEGARAAATEAAQRDRETFGEKHPVYADSLVALAERETQGGDSTHAIAHLDQALAIDLAAYGDSAVPVMIAEHNLASTLGQTGKLDAAIPHAERALALAEKLRGPEAPETAQALATIASLAAEQRDFARANETAQRALAIVEKSFGPSHPMAAALQADLGEWALRAGDPATAETRLRSALAAAIARPESPDVAMIRTALGDALLARGKRSEGIQQLEAALALRQKIGDERDRGLAVHAGTRAVAERSRQAAHPRGRRRVREVRRRGRALSRGARDVGGEAPRDAMSDDAALVTRALAREPDAVHAVDAAVRAAAAAARRLGGDHATADEIAQRVSERMWLGRDGGEPRSARSRAKRH